ncbi:MAG TPA: alpha-ketoglutarate-dependent dioxygenase AlkB [Candidatus Dormibacteraeota bacterium]
MPESPRLAWQASLFEEPGTPGVDPDFAALVRHRLDDTAWVDHVPGWLRHADDLFAWVLESAPCEETEQEMYGRVVATPRLVARWPYVAGEVELPPVLEEIRAALAAHYERAFDSVSANLYRDGRDSVAWHGDRVARTVAEPHVAILSLGHPRRFLLRPRGGATRLSLEPQNGDLVVMGGTSQRGWQHTIPKVAAAGPRISVTLRQTYEACVAGGAQLESAQPPLRRCSQTR